MAKINNTTAYPNITPTPSDFVILTDVSDSDATKTCTVDSLQGFFGTNTLVKTLTSAELLASFTTPIVLVAAQGAGKVIIPYGTIVYKTDFNTTVYDFTGATIQYETLIYNTLTTATLNSAVDVIAPSDTSVSGGPGVVANNNLLFKATTADPTQGDGTLTINLQYRVVEI